MTMTMKKQYTAIYERDETGWWVASIKEVSGCHTQGRSIKQARTRIREALSLFVRDAKHAEIIDQIKLTREMKAAVAAMQNAKKRVELQEEKARVAAQSVARLLTREFHLSVRDVGEILSLSHQRVEQLARGS